VDLIRPGSVEVSAWEVVGLAGLGAGVRGDREQLEKLRGEEGKTFTRRKEWGGMTEYMRWVEACQRFTRWSTH
jgi:hypothetical protein